MGSEQNPAMVRTEGQDKAGYHLAIGRYPATSIKWDLTAQPSSLWLMELDDIVNGCTAPNFRKTPRPTTGDVQTTDRVSRAGPQTAGRDVLEKIKAKWDGYDAIYFSCLLRSVTLTEVQQDKVAADFHPGKQGHEFFEWCLTEVGDGTQSRQLKLENRIKALTLCSDSEAGLVKAAFDEIEFCWPKIKSREQTLTAMITFAIDLIPLEHCARAHLTIIQSVMFMSEMGDATLQFNFKSFQTFSKSVVEVVRCSDLKKASNQAAFVFAPAKPAGGGHPGGQRQQHSAAGPCKRCDVIGCAGGEQCCV